MSAPTPRRPRAAVDRTQADYLAQEFPGWRIWRTRGPDGRPAGWVATRRAIDDVEPTLHADTAVGLERLLESPGRRFGRPLAGGAL